MAHHEDYLQGLYEDEGLTDELEDEAAQTLLSWAEAEYKRLIATTSDEATLEAQLKLVRRAMKSVNKFVVAQLEGDEEAMQQKLTQFVDTLTELGHIIHAEAVDGILQAQAELNQTALVLALTALPVPAPSPTPSTPIEDIDDSEQAPFEPFI